MNQIALRFISQVFHSSINVLYYNVEEQGVKDKP